MEDILNVTEKASFDNSITGVEMHSYQSYNGVFNNSDEIRIVIQKQDLIIHSAASYIYIEGTFLKADDSLPSTTAHLVQNPMCHLFDDVQYQINNVTIDRTRNPGITSTMKQYISLNRENVNSVHHTGWFEEDSKLCKDGKFSFCVPLKNLFGSAEDFSKVFINAKHELILIRSRNDDNAMICKNKEKMKITINKIIWRTPHVKICDSEKLRILRLIENNTTLQIYFRKWDLFEYPTVPCTEKTLWTIKTTSQLETPRFVIIGFQTNRKNNIESNASLFDHIGLRSIKLHLNSEAYPYENINVNFDTDQYTTLYQMYSQFQQSYYNTKNCPILSYEEYKTRAPLIVIDCRFQLETIRTGSVDISLEIETHKAIPALTSCYALILHDKLVNYNVLTGQVKEM